MAFLLPLSFRYGFDAPSVLLSNSIFIISSEIVTFHYSIWETWTDESSREGITIATGGSEMMFSSDDTKKVLSTQGLSVKTLR